MGGVEQQMDGNISAEHQQFVLHQEDTRGMSVYEAPVNIMALPPGYWPTELQQQQLTPNKHLNPFLPTSYCPPPHQPQMHHTNGLNNGEVGSVFFFSPPFPYPHPVSN